RSAARSFHDDDVLGSRQTSEQRSGAARAVRCSFAPGMILRADPEIRIQRNPRVPFEPELEPADENQDGQGSDHCPQDDKKFLWQENRRPPARTSTPRGAAGSGKFGRRESRRLEAL